MAGSARHVPAHRIPYTWMELLQHAGTLLAGVLLGLGLFLLELPTLTRWASRLAAVTVPSARTSRAPARCWRNRLLRAQPRRHVGQGDQAVRVTW